MDLYISLYIWLIYSIHNYYKQILHVYHIVYHPIYNLFHAKMLNNLVLPDNHLVDKYTMEIIDKYIHNQMIYYQSMMVYDL